VFFLLCAQDERLAAAPSRHQLSLHVMTQSTSQATALLGRQELLGARFIDKDGVALAVDYGDVRAELESLIAGAGLVDLANFGVLRVEGPTRVEWLHRLVTTNVRSIADGHGAYGLLLDATAHVIADFTLLKQPDALILYSSAPAKAQLLTHLRRAIFREKVTVHDTTPDWAVLTLQGKMARQALDRLLGEIPPLGPFQVAEREFDGAALLAVRHARTGVDGFDILGSRDRVSALWDAAIARGVRPVGWEALNIARTEAGIPWFGEDFDEAILAPEARLDTFIAENRGCYPGQEVISRTRNRGHVNRLLIQFLIAGEGIPERGATVLADNREVGWITTAVWSHRYKRPLALGYIRRELAIPGQGVRIVVADGQAEAQVRLPQLDASGAELSRAGE
jgi:folate-binding protein YgfZ